MLNVVLSSMVAHPAFIIDSNLLRSTPPLLKLLQHHLLHQMSKTNTTNWFLYFNNIYPNTNVQTNSHDSAFNSTISYTRNVNIISIPLGKHLTPWIIDTGATHHITYSLYNFSTYVTFSPFIMKMSNSHTTSAIIFGTVILSPSITLKNGYYIPSFIFNVIFVTQLTSSSKFFFMLTSA